VLAAVSIAGLTAEAGAGTAPPTAALRARSVIVPAAGANLAISLSLSHAQRCIFGSRPKLSGLPASAACTGASIRHDVRIPRNRNATIRRYTVSVTVQGAGGTVTRQETVRQRGAATAATAWWIPPVHAEWQWELDHPLNLSSASDLGTGDHTYAGAGAATPTIYDITNPASTVSALHARGDHVICYIEVGAAGDYYGNDDGNTSYFAELQGAGDLGKPVAGYPESYLNINAPSTLAVVESLIKNECAAKGFDAVEPDLDDSYTDATGFSITEQQNVAFDAALSNYAHSLGLSWGLKNGDTADGFATDLQPHVDFVLDEQCFQYGTCGAFYPAFSRAGKAVFEVEYGDQGGPAATSFCPLANADGFNAVTFDSNLDGKVRIPCR
jgi:hypothetical protein